MSAFLTEHVTAVRHWNEQLFSFRTSRDESLRFRNGQFVMVGLEVDGKPLARAYSIASANYEEELEFFSIKVQNGPLTSRLQHISVGDPVLVSRKPVGSLVLDDLRPGRNLYLLSTGTGLAPFLSVVKDPETYERFERVVLVHGARRIKDLAYADYLQHELGRDEIIGKVVKEKLMYYATVTREPFRNRGRLTDLIESGRLFEDIGLPTLDPKTDRAMVCGSSAMLEQTRRILDAYGLSMSPQQGVQGDYVIERAFAER
jgi:ferredoxin--NADP+ reductase